MLAEFAIRHLLSCFVGTRYSKLVADFYSLQRYLVRFACSLLMNEVYNVLVPFKDQFVLEASQAVWHLVESMMSRGPDVIYLIQIIKNRFKPNSVSHTVENG